MITTLGRRLVAAGQAPTALESAAPARWAGALIRPALPLLVLAIGAGLGLAVVGWCARRDGVIAGVAQLQRAVQLPVLGQVATVPAGGARAWARLCAGPQLGWAGLVAVWTMVTVITVVVGSGPVAWSRTDLEGFDIPISAGVHTLRWSYEKDEVLAVGADSAWIDAIEFIPEPGRAISSGAALLTLAIVMAITRRRPREHWPGA